MVSDFDKSLVEKYIPVNKQKKALKKLEKGYPIQYLIGDVDFYGCKILVNKNVLIPRFETESLVDKLLNYIKKFNFINPKIIDMGTGSGCISIFLKKNIKCDILAIDKSLKALKVAKKNAKLNNTDITFKHISIEKFKSTEKLDILVSNPPYIDFNDEVDAKTKYEPPMALFAPKKGLYFYEVILNNAKNYMNTKNIIAFEIGYNEGKQIVKMAKENFPNADVFLEKDLDNKDRFIFIVNK